MTKEKKEKGNEKEIKEKINQAVPTEEIIKKLEEKNKELFAGWQRAEADFLNYKKKESERLSDFSFLVKENVFEGLLPVLDNFDLAEKAIPEDKKTDNNIKGLLLIKKQLDYFLCSMGIQKIEAIGLPFNAETCEAIEEVETDCEPGIVVEEVQKGYKLNDKIIRPAKVKISKN
ncbi:MAG: nucleotide exchange factor GrpE [Candidatus Paceibacterota bacterium]